MSRKNEGEKEMKKIQTINQLHVEQCLHIFPAKNYNPNVCYFSHENDLLSVT